MAMGPGPRIGAFKPVKGAGLDAEKAEALAASALGTIAEQPDRLTRFLADTGFTPADLMARAGEREVLVAVLEHVAGDESLLLVVAATHRVKPEEVMQALHTLQTPGQWSV
jgi:membrane-bound ClpP family serine protease